MDFLLKIVGGPNKGAEIALVGGVAVTLGKGEDCDIVLADSTLPGAPLSIEAAASGVLVDGEALEPFAVKTVGATSFAVGPADAPWKELNWPVREAFKAEGLKAESSEPTETPESPEHPESPKHRHGGCILCLTALLLLFIAIAAMLWFLRDNPRVVKLRDRFVAGNQPSPADAPADGLHPSTLSAIARKYGVSLDGSGEAAKMSGDFATRAERLAATAEAYAENPGIELDFSDDESLKTAAEDTFALVGEKDLRVAAVTNRVLVLSGAAADLRRAMDALAADLPKLRGVDAAAVSVGGGAARPLKVEGSKAENSGASQPSNLKPSNLQPSTIHPLPVCGILIKPYPCLVMRNGARVMEGAPLGENIVLKIEADSVTLTNATGRFTWRP